MKRECFVRGILFLVFGKEGFMENFEIEGVGSVKIRRGRHIRILSVRIAPGRGVWVNVPYGVSGRQAKQFLLEKKEWIVQHLSQMKIYEKDTGVGLAMEAEVRTKLHILKITESETEKPAYRIESERITLFIPRGTRYESVEGIVQKFLLEIYKMEAHRILPERVRFLAEKFGFTYKRLTFRNNVSNWGSCSQEDHISLNIKLMKLPDELIDYVILHELCHTLEKNHSGNFWALVKKVCPDFDACRKKLKNYNTRL